jgi:hypothetical protein
MSKLRGFKLTRRAGFGNAFKIFIATTRKLCIILVFFLIYDLNYYNITFLIKTCLYNYSKVLW